jgi:hypothetical protein
MQLMARNSDPEPRHFDIAAHDSDAIFNNKNFFKN